jgi:Na+-translocating ferredoxin:NAD+ oxidoreductase subunit B
METPDIYRQLQQHLDRQAVGFPPMKSGADLRLLRRFFTPEEARLALHLTFRYATTQEVAKRAEGEYAEGRVRELLESMFNKGAIGWRQREEEDRWCVMPMVVGMYEAQDGEITREFIEDARAYMRTPAFGKSFLATEVPQMRTIPIHKSIDVERPVATYDRIRAVVEEAAGPFVALKCVCREGKALDGKPCAKTTRLETCLGMNGAAATVLRRKHGQELKREEALALLDKNEEEGLVLQPANAQKPDFVCSCCGCCCGLLAMQKMLPRPVDFWASNYYAEVDLGACASCGKCVARCQVNAIRLKGKKGTKKGIQIKRSRCIGCGLCVPSCAKGALRLIKKEPQTVPPRDEEALYEEIHAKKKGAWGIRWMFVKMMLGMRR